MSTQQDRKLLELAARAAGMPMCSEWDAATDGILIGSGKGDLSPWNPLTNDGDAFRLAVKLGLGISIPLANKRTDVVTFRGPLVSIIEPHGDPLFATRRAIVRAAAKLAEGDAS